MEYPVSGRKTDAIECSPRSHGTKRKGVASRCEPDFLVIPDDRPSVPRRGNTADTMTVREHDGVRDREKGKGVPQLCWVGRYRA